MSPDNRNFTFELWKQLEQEDTELIENEINKQKVIEAFDPSGDFLVNNPDVFYYSESYKQFVKDLFVWYKVGEQYQGTFCSLFVGPQKSGKSAVLWTFFNDSLKERPDWVSYFNYNKPPILDGLCDNSDATNQMTNPIDIFFQWFESLNKNAQFLLIDNLPIALLGELQQLWKQPLDYFLRKSKHKTIYVVISVDTLDYHHLKENTEDIIFFGKTPKKIYIQFHRPIEIKKMLQQRLDSLDFLSEKIFSDNVLQIISEFSFGLPGLGLWISHLALQTSDKWTEPEDMLSLLYQAGFVPAIELLLSEPGDHTPGLFNKDLWPIIKPLQEIRHQEFIVSSSSAVGQGMLKLLLRLETDRKPFSTIRTEILRQLGLKGIVETDAFVPRSKLRFIVYDSSGEIEQVKQSTLSYHTQILVKEKAIVQVKLGKEKLYALRTPMHETVEIALFN